MRRRDGGRAGNFESGSGIRPASGSDTTENLGFFKKLWKMGRVLRKCPFPSHFPPDQAILLLFTCG